MSAITFDTYKAVKQLTSQGVSPAQAEVFVDVILQSRETDMEGLVTKADLYGVKAELKTEIAEVKNELLKWYIGIAMFQTVTFLGGIIAIAKIVHS